MALNFKQSMASIHMRAKEVTELAGKGDPLSLRVINYYRQAWEDFHKARMDESLMDKTLVANLIATVTEYLHRDLTISDLADLQTRFGHRLPTEPKVQ